jgi:hypothetical protein
MQVLRLVCSCLRNAPASDTWDLSSLLVNSSPVTSAVVTAVLEVLYSNLGALGFELQRTAGQYSLAQLLDMLLFAEAVSCSKAVLNQLAGLIDSDCVRHQLEIVLPLECNPASDEYSNDAAAAEAAAAVAAAAASSGTSAELFVLLLQLDGVYNTTTLVSCGTKNFFGYVEKLEGGRNNELLPELPLDRRQFQLLHLQVCQQLEALLFVGFKLDLQQLLQPVLAVMRNNAPYLLSEATHSRPEALFSQRLLASLGGAGSSSSSSGSVAAMLMRGCLLQPMRLSAYSFQRMFSDVVYATRHVSDTIMYDRAFLWAH